MLRKMTMNKLQIDFNYKASLESKKYKEEIRITTCIKITKKIKLLINKEFF